MSEDATLDEFTNKKDSDEAGEQSVFLGPKEVTIPSEWDVTDIGEQCDTVYRYPTYYDIEYVENGVPEIRPELIQGNGELATEDEKYRYISQDTTEGYPRTELKPYDFVLSVRGTIGQVGLVRPELGGANITANLIRLSPKYELSIPEFLKQTFLSHNFQQLLETYSTRTTIKTITSDALQSIQFRHPPLLEQRKIATVLYTVDRAIEKTEEIIRQSERVREGITQDIFTTGYYNHSEYTAVRLGPVKTSTPKDWCVKSIPDYFEIIDGDRGKNYPSGSDFSDQGCCLFLSATNVTEEGLKFDETEFITQEKDEKLRRGKLKRGDIVMTTRGTVGNFGLYDESVNYDNIRINSGMVILRPKNDISSVEYYYHLFRSGIFQRQINATSYGTAQPQTSVTDIKKMGILEPGEDEKEQISELIEDAVSEIQTQKEYRNQLRSIKRGLMQDLLSGTVRTIDTNIEVPEEIAKYG